MRTFTPKYGAVNERRNQLHGSDPPKRPEHPHFRCRPPPILKVASMQPSRIQVYFVDNDDYFLKSDDDSDDVGSNRDDNDERAIFFARGTMETVKKLRWEPDIIHCSGWVTSLVPRTPETDVCRRPFICRRKDSLHRPSRRNNRHCRPGNAGKAKDRRDKRRRNPKFAQLASDTGLMHRMALSYCDAAIFRVEEARH